MRCAGSGRPATDLPFPPPPPTSPFPFPFPELIVLCLFSPLRGGGGRGASGAFSTALSTAASGRILPPWMKRRRRVSLGGDSRPRIVCLRETTVVLAGRGMSSSRSGSAALKRMVRSKGGPGAGAGAAGGLRCEGEGGEVVMLVRAELG